MAKATDPVGNISVASPTQILVIDTTAPSPPVINTIPPTNDTTPIISGIGTIGDTITLFEGSNSIGSTTVDAYSEWSITTSALTDGSYTITAKATDPAGNVSVASTPKTLVIDTTPPVINTISPTNDTTPTITGTGLVPGFRVTIFEGSTNIGIVVVRTENASPWPWAFTLPSALTDGSYIITATKTDSVGNVSSASAAQTLVINTTTNSPPFINTITTPTNDNQPTITGTGVAGHTITLYVRSNIDGAGTSDAGTATVASNGSWSISVVLLLSHGTSYIITAKATDPAGNVSAASDAQTIFVDIIAPSAPFINIIPPTNDTTPIITGHSSNAGDTITLFEGSNSIGSTTVDAYSEWSITTSALTDGSYTITAKATDPAGNISVASEAKTLVIDTTPPSAPGINTITPNPTTSTPRISGTRTIGDTITLYAGSTIIGTSVGYSNDSGSWWITPSTLSDGSYTITAKATDPAGNVSVASAAQTLVIDTTPPSAPVINPITTPTNNERPTITGTGVTGDIITLFSGSTGIGSTTVANGVWSITPPTLYQTNIITAKATDQVGNVSAASIAQTIVIDINPPSIGSIQTYHFSWGAILNSVEDNAGGTVTVSSSAEVGQIVTITLNGNNYYGTMSGSNAIVNIPAAGLQGLTNGQSYSVVANVSDAAGNAATPVTSASFLVDTSTPSISAIGTSAFSWGAVLNATETHDATTGNYLNGTVTVNTVGVETGQIVTIRFVSANGTNVGGTYTGQVSSNVATTITVGFGSLTTGQSYSVVANVSDVNGNPATPVTSSTFLVDTTVPSISAIGTSAFSWGAVLNSIEDDADGTVTVNTVGVENGQVVTITLNGASYSGSVNNNVTTVTITADGLQGLTNGQSYTMVANVQDAAGNAAVQVTSSPFTVNYTVPSISAIGTSAFSWGAILNSVEDNVQGSVTVTTVGVEAGQYVTITFNGNTYTGQVGGVAPNTAQVGPFSASVLQGLTDGQSYTMIANVSDADGTAATPVTSSAFTVNRTVPYINAIDTNAFSWGDVLSANESNSDGTVNLTTVLAENGQTVQLRFIRPNGTTSSPFTAFVSGNAATVTIPAGNVATDNTGASGLQALTNGVSYTMLATLIGVNGHPTTQVTSSPFTVNRIVQPPLIDPFSTPTNSNELIFTGTGVYRHTITLFEGSNILGTTSVLSTGVWSSVRYMNDGTYIITAKATDEDGVVSAASASQTITVDTTIVPRPVIIYQSAYTNDTTPTITGTGVTGYTITLYAGSTSVGTDTVENSAWSITSSPPLSDGSYIFTAKATDLSGRISGASNYQSLEIDTTPPSPPGMNTILSPTTSNNIPISGTGVTGYQITLFQGSTLWGTMTVSNGTWSATQGPTYTDGSYTFTAKQTDLAGNTSAASDAQTVVVNAAAASIPVINTILTPTNDTTPTITGTGVTGDTITLYERLMTLDPLASGGILFGDSNNIGTYTVSGGVWSITPSTLAEGSYEITAKATKPNGYVTSASAAQTLVIDITPPSPPPVINTIPPTNDTTPTITGTAVTGDTITLYEGSNSIGTAIASSGSWSITLSSALTEGSYTITAKATDPAGNVSVASSAQTLVIDITPPSPPPVINTIPPTNDTTPTITGTAVTGDTITLYEGSNSIGTSIASSGSWSITLSSALTEGSYTITAKATDPAGNVSVASSAQTLVIDTTAPSISAIATSAFSWGAVLNAIEDNSDGTVDITTVGVEDGQPAYHNIEWYYVYSKYIK